MNAVSSDVPVTEIPAGAQVAPPPEAARESSWSLVQHEIRELFRYSGMLRRMVGTDLRSRYKGSMLGFLWTFVHPLLMLAVYTFVFSFVIKNTHDHYALFLMVGLLPWQFHQQTLQAGTMCLLRQAQLLKRSYFPRSVIPLSVVFSGLVNYILCQVLLLPLLWISASPLSITLLAFPLVCLVHTLMLIAMTLMLAVCAVSFRDLEHIATVVLQAWFFLTPIFYDRSLAPEHIRGLFALNPLTIIFESYRAVLLDSRWPDWSALGVLSIGVVAVLFASLFVFVRAQRKLAEEL